MGSNNAMKESLDYEDAGTLIAANANKLVTGEGDEQEAIRKILETLARTEAIRARNKSVDLNGRVSVGRDLSHEPGLTVFHPDQLEALTGEEPEDGEGGDADE